MKQGRCWHQWNRVSADTSEIGSVLTPVTSETGSVLTPVTNKTGSVLTRLTMLLSLPSETGSAPAWRLKQLSAGGGGGGGGGGELHEAGSRTVKPTDGTAAYRSARDQQLVRTCSLHGACRACAPPNQPLYTQPVNWLERTRLELLDDKGYLFCHAYNLPLPPPPYPIPSFLPVPNKPYGFCGR